MSSRTTGTVLLLAAVLLLSVAAIGAAGAAPFSSSDASTLDQTTNNGVLDSADTSLSAQEVQLSEDLEERDDEVVLLLAVERNIDTAAYTTSEVDSTTLKADSEATLGPVADAVSAMEAAEVRNQFWVGNIVSVKADLGVHDAAEFARIDGVRAVAPNTELSHPSPVQEDSDVSIDQTDNFTYGLEQINVPGFEDKYNVSGEGATVSIIDDGISSPDDPHPDLDFATKAVAEGGEVTTGTLGTPGSHGEHTAGTATGAADPAGDVPRYGVAPSADLIKINTFEGQAAAEDTLASVQFSVEQGADVASMSLGFPAQSGNSVLELLMEQQMQDALAAGTVVVGSAGNAGSGAAGGPATSPGAEFSGFSIGASNEAGGIAGFSSGAIVDRFSVDYVDVGGGTQYPDYYPRQYVKPDVSAPGVGVLSSGPLGGDIGDPAATYSYSSGTSMAAPHVAGAVALIQSATEADVPAPLVKSALAETAEKPDNNFPSLNSRDIRYGTGIINVTAATDAILDGNLTIEGEVTDSEGNPVVGATVETDTGALTSTDENGSYTLQTTSESVNVTADAFGFAPETKLVEDDTSPVNFTLADEVAVDLLDGQPAFVEFGGAFDVTVDVANLENLTLDLTAESDVAAEDVTVTLDGDELPLGEPVEFNETVNGQVTLSVSLASDGTYAEGDLLGLEHTFEGAGDSLTVETGPTELTETLDPPEYEVSGLSAPENLVIGNSVPVSFNITNVGQQTPDSYGYQFFVSGDEVEGSLPATELNIAPGETQTVSLSVAGIGGLFDAGSVITHGARVGVWNEGGFISPPSIDPVEDNVSAELALQANGSQFNVVDLDAPLEADPGEGIDVTATIENVGELGDVQDVEFRFDGATVTNQTVDLDAFTLANGVVDSTTITFQDVTLPSDTGAFEHGVFTDDDNTTASIGVGVELTDATLVRSGSGTGATDTLSLFEDDLPVNFAPVDVVNAENVTKSVIAEADTLVLHDFGDSQAELIPTIEDDPTTGAVYLEQWTDSDAIADRVDVVGDPDSSTTAFNSAPPAEFDIEADHPIFDGVGGPGDNVTIHTEGFSDIAWFEGADGQTLASVTDQSGAGGPAAAVDPDSGSVLLSTIAVTSSTPGLGDFSSNASQILANAAEFSEPAPLEVPYFEVTDLAAPESGGTGNAIDVNATITNDANVSGTQTVEFVFDGAVAANTTVELNASESTTVEFTDVPLPSAEGTFEHGIQTANDSQFAEIVVGDLATVTVVEFGDTYGEDVLSVFEDSLSADEFETQVVNANNVDDSVIDETSIFVFNDLSGEAGTEEHRPRSDDIVSASDEAVSSGVSIDTAELIATVEAQATTGAVYLDQWGGDSDAIANRSSAIGDPASTSDDFDFGSGPVEYTIEQNHPLFDGVGSEGDVVTVHTVGTGDLSYFSGASGETLATVQNQADQGGNAVAVDPDSGSVLLSSLGVTGFVGPADYTTEAGQILANGVEVAQPQEFSGPFFDVTGLTAPAEADTGATINVSATVTNVGNETGTQDVEFVFNGSVAATVSGVELGAGNETTVEFNGVQLPSEGGVFEHGVQTANDSQTAEITVGSPDIELVELDQPDELTLEEEIATEITLTNNGSAPYEGEVLHATNLNDTAPESGAIAITANVTELTLDPGENATFSDNLGTFAEINSALGTEFGPGDDVETGYWKGQNLNFQESPDPVIEDIFSEEISIVAAGPPNVTMGNLSIAGQGDDATVIQGSYDVTAEMSHTDGASGDVPMELTIGNETATKNVSLESGQTVTVTFENATSDLEPGIYDVTMSGSNASVSANLTLSVDVGGNNAPATDTTGDGLLNDIDGDEAFDIFDVQALFNDLESPAVQNNPGLFNFNDDDPAEVSIFDVQALFEQLD